MRCNKYRAKSLDRHDSAVTIAAAAMQQSVTGPAPITQAYRRWAHVRTTIEIRERRVYWRRIAIDDIHRHDMKLFLGQKSREVTDPEGWSPDFAVGILEGESSRRGGTKPSSFHIVGLNEYCLGFRAGYFQRTNPVVTRVEVRAQPQRAVRSVRAIPVRASIAASSLI